MIRICTIIWVGVGICWAQQRVPAADERTGTAAHELREPAPLSVPALQGDPFHAVPIQIEPPTAPERPTGESISLSQLQHKAPKQARKAFARATKRSKAEEHEAAARELQAAVRIDPKFAEAYEHLGIEYGVLRRPSDAATAFRRVLELMPDAVDTRCYLGLALFEKGDSGQAEEQFRHGLRQAPDNAWCQFLLGYLEFHDEARRADGVQRMRSAAQVLPYARKFVRSLQ